MLGRDETNQFYAFRKYLLPSSLGVILVCISKITDSFQISKHRSGAGANNVIEQSVLGVPSQGKHIRSSYISWPADRELMLCSSWPTKAKGTIKGFLYSKTCINISPEENNTLKGGEKNVNGHNPPRKKKNSEKNNNIKIDTTRKNYFEFKFNPTEEESYKDDAIGSMTMQQIIFSPSASLSFDIYVSKPLYVPSLFPFTSYIK